MSAVIYAAIVVMWAVVLVPMWLRRHDAATESRSVDRFSTAMRTLSRRTTSGPGRRYVVMPRRSEGGVSVHVSGASVPAERPTPPARPATAARTQPTARATRSRATRSRTSLVARRRRLLLGLLGLAGFTFLLAAVGVLSWIVQLVVDIALVAFCAHLRAEARRASTLARQRRRPAVAPSPRRPAGRPAASAQRQQASAAAPAPAPMAAQLDDPLAATGTDEDTWEPVPVPRPTYTLKPPSPVEVPSDVIDPLRDTDPYNTMAAVYDDVAPGAEVIASEHVEIESDLDEILERRWAVND